VYPGNQRPQFFDNRIDSDPDESASEMNDPSYLRTEPAEPDYPYIPRIPQDNTLV